MEFSAYLVVPLSPDTLLRPDDLLTPEGLVVPIHAPGDAMAEIVAGAAEDGVDSIVAGVRKDLEHPGTDWFLLLGFLVIARLLLTRAVRRRLFG